MSPFSKNSGGKMPPANRPQRQKKPATKQDKLWLWLLLIPANYLIDRIVLKWSLGDLEDKGLAITEDIGKALADVRALIEKQTVVA